MKINNIEKKIVILLICLIIVCPMINAEDTFNFDDELKNIKDSGELSKTFVENIGILIVNQKSQVVDAISGLSDQNKFWDQWIGLDKESRYDFIEGLTQKDMDKFMGKYGEQFGLLPNSLKGFGEDTGFSGSAVGDQKVYFDLKRVKEYNVANKQDAIAEITYGLDSENKHSLEFKKKSGASATINVADNQKGFYFDAKTLKTSRIAEKEGQLFLDTKDPFSGQWNGGGDIVLEVGADGKLNIELDYNRDDEGKVIDATNFATFKNAKEDKYSVYREPTGKKDADGNDIYGTEKSNIVLDQEGRPESLENVAMNLDGKWAVPKDKFGGLFGKWKVMYDAEQYSKLTAERKKELGPVIVVDEKSGFLRSSYPYVKPEPVEAPKRRGWAGIYDAASKIAGDASENVKKGLGVDLPDLKPKNRLNFVVGADLAKEIKNVNWRAGDFSIVDSRGDPVRIIKKGTDLNYYLSPDINKDNPRFNGINFNLLNINNPNSQIQVYSNSVGEIKTESRGGALESLTSTMKTTTKASATVFTGPRGGISITVDDGIASGEYEFDQESVKRAEEFLDKGVKEYRELYDKFNKDKSISKEENAKLNEKAYDLTFGYYGLLNKGDSRFTVESLSSTKPQEFRNSMSRDLPDQIDAFIKSSESASSTQSPAFDGLKRVFISRFTSDSALKDIMAQRNINPQDPQATTILVNQQLTELSSFLRSNIGDSLQFVEDSRNNLYQFKYGTNTLNLDPAIAPFVSDVLPIIIGSGAMDSKDNFKIRNDVWNNRVRQGERTIVGRSSIYHPLRGILRARGGLEKASKDSVREDIIRQLGVK